MTVESSSFLAIKSLSPHVSKALTAHTEISQINFPLVVSTAKFDTDMDNMIKSLKPQIACCQVVKELQNLIQGVDKEISFI